MKAWLAMKANPSIFAVDFYLLILVQPLCPFLRPFYSRSKTHSHINIHARRHTHTTHKHAHTGHSFTKLYKVIQKKKFGPKWILVATYSPDSSRQLYIIARHNPKQSISQKQFDHWRKPAR